MRKYILMLLGALCLACSDVEVGYLKVENAEYIPNTLSVKKTLDPVEDQIRIANDAPWVTGKIQGVLGTNPLIYSFVSVKAPSEEAAKVFEKEIIVRGCGIMELPLETKLPEGDYTVTLKVENESHSKVFTDVFTFNVQK